MLTGADARVHALTPEVLEGVGAQGTAAETAVMALDMGAAITAPQVVLADILALEETQSQAVLGVLVLVALVAQVALVAALAVVWVYLAKALVAQALVSVQRVIRGLVAWE